MSTATMSRRSLIALGGSAGLVGALAACSAPAASGGGGSGVSGVTTAYLPGSVPDGWAPVLAKVNAKLKKDVGITLDAQYTSWTNYMAQNLLKFTAGASFDTADEALWANMAQLQQAGSLADLTKHVDSTKYPNLTKQVPRALTDTNKWAGHLWGVPQVSSAARIQHFTIRQDLADKLGFSDIGDYDQLIRFFYAVKQKGGGVIPFLLNSNLTFQTAIASPTGLFNSAAWQSPDRIVHSLNGNIQFYLDKNAATSGSANPVIFWEDPTVVQAFKDIRQYVKDGILNANGVSLDPATGTSQFTAGKFASTWAITDGASSAPLLALAKNVKGAALANVMPIAGGYTSQKPAQTFQADNNVVINANGGNVERALALQDWLSIQANHDLISYGIEGTDWKQLDNNKYSQLSSYSFPGYALCWRAGLEKRSQYMTATEEKIFDWAQDYANFTTDPFASFIPDVTPVKQASAQLSSVITQYANPLFYGTVDDISGQLSKLASAADGAGLKTVQTEFDKQASAYLKTKKA